MNGVPAAYIGIGSNLDPERHLRFAVGRLREIFGTVDGSPVYRSAAVGFDGPDFLNMVVRVPTALSPDAVIGILEGLHVEANRQRDAGAITSRTLDLDLLLHGDTVSDSPRLPHRDVLRYAFVLRPLADLAPTLRHPVNGKTMLALWSERRAGEGELTAARLDGSGG